jgi:ribose transport system permease protein
MELELRRRFNIKSFIVRNMVVVILVVLFLGFGLGTSGKFFSMANLVNLTTQMAINAMLSAGLTYVIILGGIDISVGSVAALAGVVSTLLAKEVPNMSTGMSLVMLVLPAILVGCFCGSFNGLMITRFRVVPMIATLAMQTIARGLSFIFSGGTAVSGVPKAYSWLGAGRWLVSASKPTGWIPNITIFVIIAVALMAILLSKTVFGRHVYATGSNIQVAHLSGVNTKRVIFIGHVLCSVAAALAGVLNASKLQNGQPAACDGYEMYAIAATVLGGTSLAGGSGSVARAMFGVAVIAVINNGMNLMHISSYWQKVVIGSIILLAVMMDMAQKKKKA